MINIIGKELSFCIDPNRALDISELIFNGISIGAQPPLGMLMTCGLENIGPGSTYNDIHYPQHGSLRFQEAKDIHIFEEEKYQKVSGTVYQSLEDGGKYKFNREILWKKEENEIIITDIVTNEAIKAYPIFIMYHYNFGTPFLSEKLNLNVDPEFSISKDEVSMKDQANMFKITPATVNFQPQGFFHGFNTGFQQITADNKDYGIKVIIEFDGTTLPYLNQWKHLGIEKYVIALEPCNVIPYGRSSCMEKNTTKYLQGKESVTYITKLKFLKS